MQIQDNQYQHPFHEWSSEAEVGEFIASLIKLTGAKSVLEVGVFHGITSIQLIEATPENGIFIGVDIEDLRNDEAKDNYMEIKANFVIGDSKQLSSLIEPQPFDIIFVDSMHHWQHILPEWKEVEKFVDENTIILYHDSIHLPDVTRLMDYAQRWNYSRTDLKTPGGRGLTMLKKKLK